MYKFKCTQCDYTFEVDNINEGVIKGNNHITETDDHVFEGEEFIIEEI